MVNPAGRNCRNVWTIANFAIQRRALCYVSPGVVERCIRAGTSERGCCAACGAPWRRVTSNGDIDSQATTGVAGCRADGTLDAMWPSAGRSLRVTAVCLDREQSPPPAGPHPVRARADVVPATVLDPFAGAGTTLLVADRLQRNAMGIELNAAYTEMAMERCRADAPLFSSWPPAEDPADQRMRDDAMQRDLFAEAAD